MKKVITAGLLVVMIMMCSINVFAGYVCSHCNGICYSIGCKGTEYEEREQMCADHYRCVLTLHFYDSDIECAQCGRKYDGPGAAHLHSIEDGTTGITTIVCSWY